MRNIIVHEFISLDGVIQAPGGEAEDTDGGFAHGGWTMPYWHDDIGTHFFETIQQVDALLLGRRTWEIHGGAFETMAGDPFAEALNALPKYVVSTTLASAAAWRNSTVIAGDVVAAVRQLKAQPGRAILLDGSSVLVHTLLAHGLVDDLHLHVYPLALGGGKRLFPANVRVNLQLVAARPLPTGVIYQHYRPVA